MPMYFYSYFTWNTPVPYKIITDIALYPTHKWVNSLKKSLSFAYHNVIEIIYA